MGRAGGTSSGLRYDGGGIDEHTRSRLQAEVQRMEKISLQHAQDFLHRVEEVLGLWRILLDHQFHMLANSMSQVQEGLKITICYKLLPFSFSPFGLPLPFSISLSLSLAFLSLFNLVGTMEEW